MILSLTAVQHLDSMVKRLSHTLTFIVDLNKLNQRIFVDIGVSHAYQKPSAPNCT